MIKIIKVGEIENKDIIRICYKCKTKFSYNINDVKPNRDGMYVSCPHCTAFLTHPAK